MKKNFLYAILLSGIIFGNYSCKPDKDNDPAPTQQVQTTDEEDEQTEEEQKEEEPKNEEQDEPENNNKKLLLGTWVYNKAENGDRTFYCGGAEEVLTFTSEGKMEFVCKGTPDYLNYSLSADEKTIAFSYNGFSYNSATIVELNSTTLKLQWGGEMSTLIRQK